MRDRALSISLAIAAALLVVGCGGNSDSTPSTVEPIRSTVDPDAIVGLSDVFVLHLDGAGIERVSRSDEGAGLGTPAWTADGRYLAASGPPCDDCADRIAVISMTDPAHPATDLADVSEAVGDPAWSPDGRRLVYVGGPTNAVLRAPVEGSDEDTLIDDGRTHTAVAWSPDGRRVAFTTQLPSGVTIIEVAAADGSGRRRVTPLSSSSEQPAWSPDGRRIAFARQVPGGWVVATMRASGGPIRRLTDPGQNAQQPSWSPDGTRIVFTAIVGTASRLAVISTDGTGRRTLPTGTANVDAPAWSPDGTEIAFAAHAAQDVLLQDAP